MLNLPNYNTEVLLKLMGKFSELKITYKANTDLDYDADINNIGL